MSDTQPLMPRYETYRDSGVEWLKKIPFHWNLKRFKFLSSIKTGEKDTIDRDEYGMYPFFIRSPYVKRINSYSYDGEAVLTAGDGDIGNIFHYINGKFDYHQRVYKFSDFKEVTGKFLYYYLHYNLAQEVIKLSAKTTVDSLRLNFFKNFPVALPTFSEQKIIANFLDRKTAKIDRAVAIKEEQIHLLKEQKQILIQNAVTRGLDPDTPVRDSGVGWIGLIPEHWQISANRTLFKERVVPGKKELPLLSVSIHSGVSSEELDETNNIHGRVKIEDKAKYSMVKPGDIVFNMMRAWQGAIGSVSIRGMVSPAYIVAKPEGRINSKYFEYQYRCPVFIQQMDRFSKGITDFRKRLYWDEFKQLITLVPPIREQNLIVDHIQTQSAKIDKAIALQEKMIERLQEYKATLINSVVTGKVKVPDLEKEVMS